MGTPRTVGLELFLRSTKLSLPERVRFVEDQARIMKAGFKRGALPSFGSQVKVIQSRQEATLASFESKPSVESLLEGFSLQTQGIFSESHKRPTYFGMNVQDSSGVIHRDGGCYWWGFTRDGTWGQRFCIV